MYLDKQRYPSKSNMGYDMINKRIQCLEEDFPIFEYEPGDIIKALFENSNRKVNTLDFKDRMRENVDQNNDNNLFKNMRTSLRKAGLNKD